MNSHHFILIVLCTVPLSISIAQAAPRDDMLAELSRCDVIADDRIFLDCVYGAAQPVRANLGLQPAPISQQNLVPTVAYNAVPLSNSMAQAAPRGNMLAELSRCDVIADDRIFLDCVYGAAQPVRAELDLQPAPISQQTLVPTIAYIPGMLPAAINSVDVASYPVQTGWDVAVGAGAVVRPTFEGSDRYFVTPVPFISATYDDFVSLGMNGLSVYWHHKNFRVGGSLTYGGGRKDTESNNIFSGGDNRINGLGNINGAPGFKAFASYDWGLLDFSGSVTKFTGSGNNGLLADMGVALPYRLSPRFAITPHLGATWANQNYMQTFFGVTPVQAENSHFSEFTAGSGFKDVNVGINFNYRFNRHWFVVANADMKELTDGAAKSPISFSNKGKSFVTMIGYHF